MDERINAIVAKIKELRHDHPNMRELALHVAVDSWLAQTGAELTTLSEFRDALRQADK